MELTSTAAELMWKREKYEERVGRIEREIQRDKEREREREREWERESATELTSYLSSNLSLSLALGSENRGSAPPSQPEDLETRQEKTRLCEDCKDRKGGRDK